jgi:RNA polymerase sigma factor (TIGR02999 family)
VGLALNQAKDLIALDEALTDFEKLDPRKARVVELRYFGGMTVDETAEALGVSAVTVRRDWNSAKGWLLRELSHRGSNDA